MDDDLQDDSDVVTDITDEIEDFKNKIPMYSSRRPVGVSLVTEAKGFYCKPCGRFFLNKEKSDAHCRSEMHYKAFVKILNEKSVQAEEKKRKSSEENEEGNWKRRKVDDSENENNDEADEDSKNVKNGSELYDPADSFMSTDANDSTLDNTETEDNADKDEKMWEEVDKDLTEILDNSTETGTTPAVNTSIESKTVTPPASTKAKPTTRTSRGRKGKKSN